MIGSKQKLNASNHPKDSSVSIRINADDIRWVGNTKYIGIQIDYNLAWDDQIKTIKVKVSGAVGLLKRAIKVFNNDVLC